MTITEPLSAPSSANSGLRVLFHTYDWAFQRPGGGEIQLHQTRAHLQQLGVAVDLFDRWQTRMAEYPLVHSFSLQPHEFWGPARNAGCAVAVSTIHWPWAGKGTLREKLEKFVVRSGKRLLRINDEPKQLPFHNVDIFFPNSRLEGDLLSSVYGIPQEKIHVVPNGVDERFAAATPDAFVEQFDLRDFILCVGRIDPCKNQLMFVRAVNEIDRPVVLIGEPVLGQDGYYQQCRSEARSHIHFLGRLSHDSALLRSAYAAASLVVMPSQIETAGLSGLEAGLAGTPVVVTERGGTREYYADGAMYLNPTSVEEMREVIRLTLDKPLDPEILRERVRTRYLWKHAAEATLQGYEKVLGAGLTTGRGRLAAASN